VPTRDGAISPGSRSDGDQKEPVLVRLAIQSELDAAGLKYRVAIEAP
jgi:hypothetical protein